MRRNTKVALCVTVNAESWLRYGAGPHMSNAPLREKEIRINLESNIRALHLGYDVKKPRVYAEPRVTVLFGLQEK